VKRVVVCIKPVPDPKEWGRLRMDPDTKTLIREEIPSVINPLDKHAIEAALEIKDGCEAEVVLLAMAPLESRRVLREALAMGADRAVLLSDKVFAGSDTLATARILAAGIRKIGSADLIFCGNLTLDGSTAQVPSQVAELLGIPSIMHVSGMDRVDGRRLLITQKIEQGYARLEAKPPLLLALVKEANRPRYISFLEILAAEKREITIWSNKTLKIGASLIGLSGSPTKMANLLLHKKERRRIRLNGDPGEIARQLAEKMHQIGII
jgi:electron transfer flavoprotein beta subunit